MQRRAVVQHAAGNHRDVESEMKVFRFSGSPSLATRSADTIVPWMTSRSIPACSSTRRQRPSICGLSRTAVVTPASRMRATAGAQQALGSAVAGMQLLEQPDCRGRFGLLFGGLDKLSDLGFDIGMPPDQPSPLKHAQAPSLPSSIANSGDTKASVGCATTGISTGRRPAATPSTRPVTNGCGRRHDADFADS